MIRVMIVDDQELMRQSLKVILNINPNIEVQDTASSGPEALKKIGACPPDMVLMDIRMPGMDGVEATRLIKEKYPAVKVIVLTTFDDDEYVFGALKNGASGYLLKGSNVSELSEAIHVAYSGGAMINPHIATKVISQFSRMAKSSMEIQVDPKMTAEITRSEWPVIQAVGRGLSNKEIAAELHLSEGTVRNAISSVLLKLDLRDRTQLAIWAVQTGVVNRSILP